MSKTRRFLYNGAIMTLSALIIRAVSVSFNVFISSSAGAEGMGLFQLVTSVYSPALTLATAGVYLCSSRLVAEELSKKRGGRWRGVLGRCLLCALLSSLPVTLLLFSIAPYVSESWLGGGDASSLLRLMSLSLPFIALSSCLNGFFTAAGSGGRSAILQLAEQGVKIALTYFLIAKTYLGGTKCLFAVVIGNVCADLFSCVFALALSRGLFRRLPRGSRARDGSDTCRILGITLPVSVSSFLRSSLIALEHILIPRGLKKSGASYSEALASYGTLTGMAMPIIMFPASFMYSFSSLTVPELASVRAKGDRDELNRKIKRIFGAFLTFSVGASGLILTHSELLGRLIYKSSEASVFLAILSPLIPFMYLDTVTDSMLKGIGEQVYTMRINVIDAAASVISVTVLVPKMGIMGYVAVILISELINFGFSVRRLRAVTGVRLGVPETLPRILLSAVAAALISNTILQGPPQTSGTLALCISVVLYTVSYTCGVYLLSRLSQSRKDKVIKIQSKKYT